LFIFRSIATETRGCQQKRDRLGLSGKRFEARLQPDARLATDLGQKRLDELRSVRGSFVSFADVPGIPPPVSAAAKFQRASSDPVHAAVLSG
jgi:hypothetical protein